MLFHSLGCICIYAVKLRGESWARASSPGDACSIYMKMELRVCALQDRNGKLDLSARRVALFVMSKVGNPLTRIAGNCHINFHRPATR